MKFMKYKCLENNLLHILPINKADSARAHCLYFLSQEPNHRNQIIVSRQFCGSLVGSLVFGSLVGSLVFGSLVCSSLAVLHLFTTKSISYEASSHGMNQKTWLVEDKT